MTYNINIDDYIGRWGFSKQYISSEMKGLKNKAVTVRISSLGGSVDDALDIRQQFIDHGDVTAYLYSYVASAATIIATGAKKVKMSRYAFYLIHKVSNWVDAWGNMNADQIQQLIEDLKANKIENDKMDLVLAAMYAKKSGKTINEILPILKEGRWLTAEEALNYGFIDEIIDDGEKLNFDEHTAQKFNMLHLPSIPRTHENDKKNSFDEEGFFNRLAGFFKKKDETATPAVPVVSTENNNGTSEEDKTLISEDMKKDYVKVNSILKVDGIEFDKDGKCTFTEDQVKDINAQLDSLETTNTENTNKINDLTTQVDNLKKGDGAQTNHLEGDGAGEEDSLSRANALFNSVKDLV